MAEKTENKNKSFVLRIDTETMNAIEKWAGDEFRSVNGQILFLLDQALKKNGRSPKNKDKTT
ncbi:Arc family DNA binding domain-containing protein [Bacteroidia bacterium]|nr:Arc family DNA binding domain-containing protein [Bacteroidia bacterium]